MKGNINIEEIERRFAEIDSLPAEALTQEDLAALAEADAESPAESVTLNEYMAQKEYSGRIMLRIPKELHSELAANAKRNGVSLNQYALYKLSR